MWQAIDRKSRTAGPYRRSQPAAASPPDLARAGHHLRRGGLLPACRGLHQLGAVGDARGRHPVPARPRADHPSRLLPRGRKRPLQFPARQRCIGRRIRAGFEVRTVAPRLAFTGLFSKDDDHHLLHRRGRRPGGGGAPELARSPSWRAPTCVPAVPDSVVLGEGLAANLGVHPGDLVVLLGNTAAGGVNAVELTVSGTFQTTSQGLRRHRPACTDRGRAPADAGRWCDQLGGAAR